MNILACTSIPKKWGVGSAIIKLYQNTRFSHVLIIKDNFVYEASHGNVHKINLNEWEKTNEVMHKYIIPIDQVDMEYAESCVGIKYGYMQIARITVKYFSGILINKDNKDGRLICSEFVGRALRIPWVNDYTSPGEIKKYLDGKFASGN